jgi:hypothetical protein
MARHVLTLEEQLRGLRAAIASPRTPNHLRKALRDRLSILEKKFDRQKQRDSARRKGKRKAGLMDWLGL